MKPIFKLRCSAKETQKEELIEIGDVAPDFELVDIEGKKIKLSSFHGRRVLLSFFRHAACPVCKYNVDRMKQQSEMLARGDIVSICIFRSHPKYIARHASPKMTNDAIALSDKKGSVYTSFQVKKMLHSQWFHGMVHFTKNLKIYKPYLNITDNFAENSLQLPADFLINEDGEIVDLFRAERWQDFMSFERVEVLIPENKRCKCNKHDCISPRCREEYEEIKKSSAMIFTG